MFHQGVTTGRQTLLRRPYFHGVPVKGSGPEFCGAVDQGFTPVFAAGNPSLGLNSACRRKFLAPDDSVSAQGAGRALRLAGS